MRSAIGQAAGGAGASITLDPVRDGLYPPAGFPAAWRAVQCVENHDVVFNGSGPRIAKLSDSTDSRSWYARSRSRVATGLLLTAPGIPLLFMGQEFLEDKPWSDSDTDFLIYWDGLNTDQSMQDHLRFCRELIALRSASAGAARRRHQRLPRSRPQPRDRLPGAGWWERAVTSSSP